jgi:hypothetical protein
MALKLDAGDMDSQIQDKVDAYRNNPAALQQRYQMNQDLLDLLALQKIKSEKDAAKKQLALSMAQNPQTVKQQREAETLAQTKDELTKQVGGVMALRNAQQRSNLNRVAAGQRPAVRTPVAQQGVASQPSPNMARMAKGGIVSFANGEEVEEAETREEYEARVKRADELLAIAGVSRQDFDAMSEKDKARVLETIQDTRGLAEIGRQSVRPLKAISDLIALPTRLMDRGFGTAGRAIGLLDPTKRFPGEETRLDAAHADNMARIRELQIPTTMASLQPGARNPALDSDAGVPLKDEVNARFGDGSDLSAPPPPAPAAVPTNQGVTAPSAQQMMGGINALQQSLGAGSVAYQDPTKTKAGIENEAMRQQLANITMQQAQRDPQEEMRRRQAGVGALFNRSAVAAQNQQIMDALQERNAQRTRANPFAYLRGGGGFGAVNRAFERARRADEAMFDAALDKSITAKRSGMTDDFNIAKQQAASGDTALQVSEAGRREGMRASQALITQRSEELSNVAKGYLEADKANLGEQAAKRRDAVNLMISQADNAVKADVANLQAQIQTRRNDIEEMKVEDMSAARKEKLLAEVQNMIAKVQSKYAEITADAVASHPSMMGLSGDEAAKQRKIISQPYLVQQQQTVKDLAKTAQRLRAVLSGGDFEVIRR